MTREEIKNTPKIVDYLLDGGVVADSRKKLHERMDEICNLAIKALEQEPCEMTVEEYRQRMIQAFHNADTDELIAVCVLPTEKEFEHLEWLLKNHYKKEPSEDCTSRDAVIKHICESKECYKDECKGRLYKRCWDIQWVYDLPPATPIHKKGKWVGDKSYPICPKCNCNIMEEYISCSDYAEMYKPMKYCPNCGTRMEV